MSSPVQLLNEVNSVEVGDWLYLVRGSENNASRKVAAIAFAGAPGEDGLNGVNGCNGVNGQGVPTGGTTGQALVKANNDNFNCVFDTLVANLIADATATGKGVLTAANNTVARSLLGAGTGTSNFNSSYTALTDVPSTFTPSAHNHNAVNISDSTSLGRTLVAAANEVVARAALGLGNSATLNVGTAAGTVSAGDHTHAGGSAPAGTVILLSNDETDSTEHNNSVNESNAFKTITLLPNSYNQIKVEAIVRARNDADLAADPVYTFRLKVAGNTVKTFNFTNCGTTTTGIDGGDTHVGALSTIVAGGQAGNTAITVTGQCSDANAGMGMLVHAFRVYGIL